jgi:hypothetical protein
VVIDLSPEDCDAAAAELVAGLAGAAVVLIGPSVEPTNGERKALQTATARVLAHYRVARVHPLVGLGLVVAAFIGVRVPRAEFQQETQPVRTWLGHAWAWVRGK